MVGGLLTGERARGTGHVSPIRVSLALPPGNSHSPALAFPGGLCASRTLGGEACRSTNATPTTRSSLWAPAPRDCGTSCTTPADMHQESSRKCESCNITSSFSFHSVLAYCPQSSPCAAMHELRVSRDRDRREWGFTSLDRCCIEIEPLTSALSQPLCRYMQPRVVG